MDSSLKNKTVTALLWSSADRFGYAGIMFAANIVLARILFPDDFGLIGMIAVFIAISNSVVDSGFGAALIQKNNPSQQDYSTIFYLNVGLGVVLFGIIFLMAPFIADFYEQPLLSSLLRVLSVVLVINSFAIVQSAILQKDVNFKKITQINILAALLSGVISIVCALKGLGIWSLVIQMVSMSFFKCCFYWIMTSWRPLWTFSMNSISTLWGYGSKLLISGLMDTIYQNLQSLVIGKVFTAKDLGFYTQAQRLQDIPAQTLSGVVTQVTFPVFSQLQNDQEKMKRGVQKSLKALVFLNFPLMILLAAIAKPLIVVLFTDKWLPSVPYLQLLCLSGMLLVLHTTTLSILKAKGRSDIFFHLEIVKKIIGVALLCAGILLYQIVGMIIAIVISSYVSYFLNGFYAGRTIDYSLKAQIKDVFPYYILSIIVGVVVFFLFQAWSFDNIPLVVLQVSAYAILYLGLSHIFKLEPYQVYKQIISELISKR